MWGQPLAPDKCLAALRGLLSPTPALCPPLGLPRWGHHCDPSALMEGRYCPRTRFRLLLMYTGLPDTGISQGSECKSAHQLL